jgi:hypothetical protein
MEAEWMQGNVKGAKEPQWFLLVRPKAGSLQVQGDFRFDVKINGSAKTKFYFWLNVPAIIWN